FYFMKRERRERAYQIIKTCEWIKVLCRCSDAAAVCVCLGVCARVCVRVCVFALNMFYLIWPVLFSPRRLSRCLSNRLIPQQVFFLIYFEFDCFV
uniref:Uncharacterized protein n=1 Tax=Periophthalmus magnuspinnatus TaxID=409849 RepID=A0A3B4AYH6_9GOBI